MSGNQQYLVLIGDLEGSRELPARERDNTQQKLKSVLEEIRADNATIASPPTITLGDEFQTVYRRADALFLHIWRIQAALYPLFLRFGMGRGTLSTAINTEQAIGMDGPAFHRARSALEHLKETRGLFRIEAQDPEDRVSLLINQSLDLIAHEMRGWKQRRFAILCGLKAGRNYKEISEAQGISKSAFYKNVEAGALDTIIAISDTAAGVINEKLGA